MQTESINELYQNRVDFRINDSTKRLLIEKARQERVKPSVIARRILEDGLEGYDKNKDRQ
jgi:hypothetical protein